MDVPAHWSARFDTLAERWECDPAFRRRMSTILTLLTLLGMALCFLGALVIARQLLPTTAIPDHGNFAAAPGEAARPTFSITPPTPFANQTPPIPVLVATTTLGPPATSPPPLTATPTGLPIAGATPTPTSTVGGCPSVGTPTVLTGSRIRDGVSPAPLIAGCPAVLTIRAPAQPNAAVSGTLTFSTANPGGCTVHIEQAMTDGEGNATITFTVPGTQCIRGSFLTTGTIFVGNDGSANANFLATS